MSFPLLSLDARDGPLSLGIEWIALDVFGSRVQFDLKSQTTGLVIDPVLPEDTGLYRCRVDYKASPTRNERIMLEVVVPPQRVFITNDAGLEVSGVIGPYNLGATVALTCNVEGGHPLPKITWRRRMNGGQRSSEVVSSTLGVTSSMLLLRNLKREDLYSVLMCYVINSKLTSPVSTSVTLDITFPPLEVSLVDAEKPFKESESSTAVCEAIGSRPAANITWWKNGVRTDGATSEVFDKGNVTRSTLSFTPDISDNMAQLVCRAGNPIVPLAVIETSTKIRVLYSPRLRLLPGRSLNMDDIKEGDDVYFECVIKANPKTHTVKWFLNDQELFHRISAGIILSNQSLVLQKVKRKSAGEYLCSAFNSQGSGHSNLLTLSVKYVPLCDVTRQQSYGVEQNETIHVTCNVISNPPPRQYRWAFNTSSELLDLSWVKGQTKKELIYTPKSDLDYGSLLCWAENEIGLQETPCVYHVIKSSIPGPVKNCSVKNVTSSSAFIFCQPGWDGGLEQFFTLHVLNGSFLDDKQNLQVANYPSRGRFKKKEKEKQGGDGVAYSADECLARDGGSPLPLAKATPAPKPNFYLTGLSENTVYILSISANNRKGRSKATKVVINTVGDAAEKRVGLGFESIGSSSKEFGYLPLAIFSSSLALLLFIFLIVVVILRTRHNPHSVRSTKGVTLNFALEKRPEEDEGVAEDVLHHQKDKRTPDVVPCDKSTPKTVQNSSNDQASSGFHQLKLNFEEFENPNDQFYFVESFLPQKSQSAEMNREYKINLPDPLGETSLEENPLHEDRTNINKNKIDCDPNVSKCLPNKNSPTPSDNRAQYPIDDTELCIYNENIVVVNPNGCETLNTRTDFEDKDPYMIGLSNTSLVLSNLETFLNENQLESSV